MLRLVSVTRRFGAHTALDSVSLHVRRGDCYGFLGHNGAGKTTAMRIALGLDRPGAGRVLVDGFDAERHPREARARMGGLIETPGFHGHLSGAANLVLLARLAGTGRGQSRAEAARLLDAVGLAHAGTKPVRVYSQGMRQRLGIAQALLGRPELVLLDEPTNGLDPEGIEEMRRLLVRLTRDEGITVLLSSHQLHEIAGICTRVGILRAGRLLVEEETAKLLADDGRYELSTDDDAAAARVLAEAGVATTAPASGGLALTLGARPAGDVARALVERGLAIRAFAPRPPVLEDVYLRYAQGGSAVASRAAPDAAAVSGVVEPRLARPFAPCRVVRHEASRWTSSLAVPALLAAPAVVACAAVWHRHSQAASSTSDVAQGSVFSTGSVTAFEAFGTALQPATIVLAAVVAALASQSVAGELGRGTLRNVLLRPNTRLDTAWGKFAALLVATLAAYALLAVAALVASGAAFDYDAHFEILPNGARYYPDDRTAAAMWPGLRHAAWAPLPGLAACAAVGFLAGAAVRAGAAAMGLAVGGLVALDLLRAVARGAGFEGWLPTAHIPTPLSDTSFVQFFVADAQGTSNLSDRYASLHVVAPLAWALVAFALAAWSLRRRPIP